MKKFLTMAALIMMAAMTLTSCGDDDEPKQNGANATYKMTFSQDVLDLFDVVLIYKGSNGRNIPETVTSTSWTKDASCDKLPAEFGVKYIFTKKEGVTLTKDKYDIKVLFEISLKKSSGGVYGDKETICDGTGVQKDKVFEYIDRRSGQSRGVRVTKDGGIDPDDNMNYDI